MDDHDGGSASKLRDKQLAQTQAKVNEVVEIMRVNVDKVLERDQQLSELNNRADALQDGATLFVQQAVHLKKKYWWKNLKMMLLIGAIGVVLLIIIIVYVVPSKSSEPAPPLTPAPPTTKANSD